MTCSERVQKVCSNEPKSLEREEKHAKMTTDGLMIADTVSTGLGRKFARLQPGPLTLSTQTPMVAPFGLSTFPGDKGPVTRASLDLRCTDAAALKMFEDLDAWAPKELAENSERIFGKRMSLSQVEAAYRPCLRRKEGYAPLLHTKVTLEGQNSTSFWDEQKQKTPPPEDFKNASMLVNLSVPHLWLSGGACGWVINATSCQLLPQPPPEAEQCPF